MSTGPTEPVTVAVASPAPAPVVTQPQPTVVHQTIVQQVPVSRVHFALAALASFFIPGLGQLLQNRPQPAIAFFLVWLFTLVTFILWPITFIVWLWSIIDCFLHP